MTTLAYEPLKRRRIFQSGVQRLSYFDLRLLIWPTRFSSLNNRNADDRKSYITPQARDPAQLIAVSVCTLYYSTLVVVLHNSMFTYHIHTLHVGPSPLFASSALAPHFNCS